MVYHGRRSLRPVTDLRAREQPREEDLQRDQAKRHGDVAGPMVYWRVRQE